MSTFDTLVADLTRDVNRVQPKDALQFCASWFQLRLEEQRTRTRDALSRRPSLLRDIPFDHYSDIPQSVPGASVAPTSVSPFMSQRSLHFENPSPFGTLDVPGNALLSNHNNVSVPPVFKFDSRDLPPSSPLTINPAYGFGISVSEPSPHDANDFLHPPSSLILARRTSVSAESIAVDSEVDEPLPSFPKSSDQLRRIRASIADNFIFRDLDEEQESGVLNAMQELHVEKDEVVIRQGDVGELFYVVEKGLFFCYIRPDPLPPPAITSHGDIQRAGSPQPEKFLQPGYHPVFGRKVQECKPGSSFGELALMHGHPRAASVVAIEPSTLWSLDRITFRTIILKAAHRRRSMYEHFLSTVPLLASLNAEERSKIADALVSRVYQDGEAVVRQGEMGDTFFFVEDGEARVTKRQGKDVEAKEVNLLRKGDYFGELSLLRREPRAATVSAVHRTDPTHPKLKVAALDAPAFTRLLGPLREIMERQAGDYGPIPGRLSR